MQIWSVLELICRQAWEVHCYLFQQGSGVWMRWTACGCRGPEQLVNDVPESHARGERRGAGLSAVGRERLQEFMADGQGDHILYLRLFEVRCRCAAQWNNVTLFHCSTCALWFNRPGLPVESLQGGLRRRASTSGGFALQGT